MVETMENLEYFFFIKKKKYKRIGGGDSEIVEIKWYKFYIEKNIG